VNATKPVEIPLRRKYLEVTHGRLRSPAGLPGSRRVRMEKSQADRDRAASDRRRTPHIMVMLPNGKKRMVRQWPL
jgi:hypothetical protein